MQKFIVAIAFGLIAAACGAGETSTTLESLDSATSKTLPAAAGAATPATTIRESTTSTLEPSAAVDTTAPAPAPPAELPDSDYPDVVVADLAGGEVNLRELALEAEPVLLWFWAPH